MPPRQNSRYTFTQGRIDADERFFLSDRIPFRFKQLPDNRSVVVKQSDTLYAIAGRMFAPLPRPAGLWWVIADFQPEPIHDPTIQLAAGRALIVPSIRTVTEEIFSLRRARETEV